MLGLAEVSKGEREVSAERAKARARPGARGGLARDFMEDTKGFAITVE